MLQWGGQGLPEPPELSDAGLSRRLAWATLLPLLRCTGGLAAVGTGRPYSVARAMSCMDLYILFILKCHIHPMAGSYKHSCQKLFSLKPFVGEGGRREREDTLCQAKGKAFNGKMIALASSRLELREHDAWGNFLGGLGASALGFLAALQFLWARARVCPAARLGL